MLRNYQNQYKSITKSLQNNHKTSTKSLQIHYKNPTKSVQNRKIATDSLKKEGEKSATKEPHSVYKIATDLQQKYYKISSKATQLHHFPRAKASTYLHVESSRVKWYRIPSLSFSLNISGLPWALPAMEDYGTKEKWCCEVSYFLLTFRSFLHVFCLRLFSFFIAMSLEFSSFFLFSCIVFACNKRFFERKQRMDSVSF